MRRIFALLLFLSGRLLAAEQVSVSGTIVDAETGKLIKQALIVQAGKFDPDDLSKEPRWGFSERRSSRANGKFSANVRWTKGWTARVLVDGYQPEPVLKEAPPEGEKRIEVELKLTPLRKVDGVVLDHRGKPVVAAALFAIGPTGLNLYSGGAWNDHDGQEAAEAKPMLTDAEGKFTAFPVPDDGRIAVSSTLLDAWPVLVKAEEENVEIRLPAPASIRINYDIPGAPVKTKVFYQNLTAYSGDAADKAAWKRLASDCEFEIKKGETTLDAMPPGRYQIARSQMAMMGSIGRSMWMERQCIELKAGETLELDWTRKGAGARVSAKLKLPKDVPVDGISYEFVGQSLGKDFDGEDITNIMDGGTVDLDGLQIRSAKLPPGSYTLKFAVQKPIPKERMMRSGVIMPDYFKEVQVEIAKDDTEVDIGEIEFEGLK